MLLKDVTIQSDKRLTGWVFLVGAVNLFVFFFLEGGRERKRDERFFSLRASSDLLNKLSMEWSFFHIQFHIQNASCYVFNLCPRNMSHSKIENGIVYEASSVRATKPHIPKEKTL